MTAPPDLPAAARDHGCQTPGCPNDFNVVVIRVDDSQLDLLCEGCHLAFALAILQRLGEEGLLQLQDTQPPAA